MSWKDPHLNLFYTYNRDNQLIENNLTRALIVTLSYLSPPIRGFLLRAIFKRASQPEFYEKYMRSFTFENCQFALQNHMDKRFSRTAEHRFMLTIAGHMLEEVELDPEDYHSIPDAWISDPEQGLCIVVEVKLEGNPLDHPQLQGHAEYWLGLQNKKDIAKRLISITWAEVAESIIELERAASSDIHLSREEQHLLQDFMNYLYFYGVKVFKGFTLGGLHSAPRLSWTAVLTRDRRFPAFDLRGLEPPVEFSLADASWSETHREMLVFDDLTPPPSFRLLIGTPLDK